MASTIQLQISTGMGESSASAEGGIKFSRDDTINASTPAPIPIPSATGTNYSFLKNLYLGCTTAGGTSLLNRKVYYSGTLTTGFTLNFKQQSSFYAQAASGNKPADNGSTNGAVPSGYTAMTTSAQNYDAGFGTQVNQAGLGQPTTAPTTSVAGTDGTLTAGNYYVSYTWVSGTSSSLIGGESQAKVSAAAQAVSGTNHLTVTIPALVTNAVAANIYVSPVGGTNVTSTHLFAGTTTGTTFNITANPSGSANNPPATECSQKNGPYCLVVLGVDNTFAGGAGSNTSLGATGLSLQYDEQAHSGNSYDGILPEYSGSIWDMVMRDDTGW